MKSLELQAWRNDTTMKRCKTYVERLLGSRERENVVFRKREMQYLGREGYVVSRKRVIEVFRERGRCSVRSKDVDMTIVQVNSLDEELWDSASVNEEVNRSHDNLI